MYIQKMITTLQDKPAIGIVASFGSATLISIKDFLSNDAVLNWVRIGGVWLGFMIAMLTGIIKIIELLQKVKHKNGTNGNT